MNKYVFKDTSYGDYAELDLSGNDFVNFVKTCAKYCTAFSLRISDLDTEIPSELKKLAIPFNKSVKETVDKLFGGYYCYDEILDYPEIISELGLDKLSLDKCVSFYKITDESLTALLSVVYSLYEYLWESNFKCPEDLTFYREDGSVFFTSTTHEGECELTVRDGEDVSDIILKNQWMYVGNDGELYDCTLMTICDMEKLEGEKAAKMRVVNRLVLAFPNLKTEVIEYLNDFDDVYLHLILGDIFNPFMLSLLDGTHPGYDLWSLSFFIEYLSNMDEYIQEVVVTTVLERLSDEPEKFKLFSQFAGKQTKRFIEEMSQ